MIFCWLSSRLVATASVISRFMKTYHDIAGDGGSNVAGQVAAQQARIGASLEGVRVVAIGSGKGGVGKSTLTFQIAALLQARGRKVALLDADFNGPTQARLAGLKNAMPLPSGGRVALPRGRGGFGVFSIGSLVAEGDSLEFEAASSGASHTWRATREFTVLGEVLASVDWGRPEFLLVDLPPGAERLAQYAEFFGARAAFVLVTIPSDMSRGVVARSVKALRRAGGRAVGYVENMSGYFCAGCGAVRPLFSAASDVEIGLPRLAAVPFDPDLAALCDAGIPITERPGLAAARFLGEAADAIVRVLEE